MVVLLVVACVLLILIYAALLDRKPSSMPPGPAEVPFVGQRPPLTAAAATELRRLYGDIVTERLGNTRTVLLFNYTDVRELFSKPEFAPRPHFFGRFNFEQAHDYGVLFNNDHHWSHSRRFIQRQLRELGTGGTSRLEGAVHTEASALVEQLAALDCQPSLYPQCFEIAVLNVLWQFVADRRYELDAEEVSSIFHLTKGVKRYAGNTVLMGLFPVLTWLPDTLQQTWLGQSYLRAFLHHMRDLIVRSVEEHLKVLDPEQPRDFIDDYLTEMQQQEEEDPKLKLTLEGLYQLLLDLFNTGSDTMANMLQWVVHYCVQHPDIARRCQKLIDDLVPRDQLVSLDHKKQLPYLEAFTTEVLRHSSMVVFLPQRCAARGTTLRGYTLPKGTAVTTCSQLINTDPQHWQQPQQFSPERFLDQTGEYRQQRDGYLPFGIGRRQCAGEALARSELFLFTAAILQNFTLELPEGATLDTEAHELLGIRTPADQPIIYRPRL